MLSLSSVVHNSDLMRAKKKNFDHLEGQNWSIKYANFAFIYIKINNIPSQLGLAGQMLSLRGPHLARGPYVVHA